MEVGIGTVMLKPPDGKDPAIQSPKELANQDEIKYGLIIKKLNIVFFYQDQISSSIVIASF